MSGKRKYGETRRETCRARIIAVDHVVKYHNTYSSEDDRSVKWDFSDVHFLVLMVVCLLEVQTIYIIVSECRGGSGGGERGDGDCWIE